MQATQPRVNEFGEATKGSQRQVQLYVNHYRAELGDALREALPELSAVSVDWRTPLERDRFREYRDAAFLRALNLERLGPSLRSFWPRRGPVWDGLAVTRQPDETSGVLLVEGKSYPGEMKSRCAAGPTSRALIEKALSAHGGPITDAWLNSYYQLANRLAHRAWLERAGVAAYLVFLCFLNDTEHVSTTCEEWGSALNKVMDAMELDLADEKRVAHVFLEAKPRVAAVVR